MTRRHLRPVPGWLLGVAVAAVVLASALVGQQLASHVEQRAVRQAGLTAQTVVAMAVEQTVTVDHLDGAQPLPTSVAAALDRNVEVLAQRGLLYGLEVWRSDGVLLFADAGHPTTETRMPLREQQRTAAESTFLQPGDRTVGGQDTVEVFLSYDADHDGSADGTVEVVLPSVRAEVTHDIVKLYVALGLATFLVGTALVQTNRRARIRQAEALRDPLTGLGNRMALRRAEGSLRGRTESDRAALILFDLDRFKAVNDTLGHQAGDALLVQVAEVLTSLVSPTDLVVRLGGDEFAVLIPDVPNAEAALTTARTVIDGLHQGAFAVQGVLLDVRASAGVAMLPDDATDVAGLLQRADIAMYAAKRLGAGVVPYSCEVDPHDVDQLQLLAELRYAIDHDELVLHYQPKAELDSSEVLSVEALVRWVHPRHGLLQPGAFIPMAEVTGLIQPLTAWVLEQACRQAALWRSAGRPLAVAVNISPRSLVGGDLPTIVLDTLTRTGLPAHLLELEITETAVMADPAGATAVLQQLDAMGIRVSLDDFGTGYTSMALLPSLPVHALKIDRTFITGMLGAQQDAAVAESLLTLAHRFGLRVVAEGVETLDVWDRLRELGCEQAQGFYLARPMPADTLDSWLQQRTSVGASSARV
ncbi:bifunctional diguanylate cyclase/phosphodiesterase [Cellulomonas sp. URHE0023]|uniref:putative bifunctional diguanylate cyclase/phosphodiesterase n=1 Tax=Cellulomonas sp. URHE0023 TaxID=1380354 RepID=UPI0018CC269F|nr:bifunctional diguanylate cyclase/phosphodiesterase [Cellulomonas sp. URHE0023]